MDPFNLALGYTFSIRSLILSEFGHYLCSLLNISMSVHFSELLRTNLLP